MQNNTINIWVDASANIECVIPEGGANSVGGVLERSEETLNRSTYTVAGEHSLVARSICQLYRTFPKRAGDSRGSAKCAIKLTRDYSVPNAAGSGEIVLPFIAEVNLSMPVGLTGVQIAAQLQRLARILVGSTFAEPYDGMTNASVAFGALACPGYKLATKLEI